MAILIQLAILAILLAFAVKVRSWIRSMRRDIYAIRDDVRAIKRSNELLGSAINDAAAQSLNAAGLAGLGLKFPVFLGGWSIDSFLARSLIEHILECRPKCIVELGSGSSTTLIARTLQILDEKETCHIAVDHDSRYLALTRVIADLNGVANNIEFLHCPLLRYESMGQLWYGGLSEMLGDRKIDLLIIDGPPGPLQPMSRYPALPLLVGHLGERCTVILDDAIRDEEQKMARRWVKEDPSFELTFSFQGHGLAILKR